MRVKLTAKHPRSGSSERAPVRSGSTTARKPTRPHGPRPATPDAGARERAPGGAGKRPAGKPAGASGDTGRTPAGARPARPEGSFSRQRDAGGSDGPRRAPSDRPPRRDGDAGAPRKFDGERGERAPRREGFTGAPRRAEGAERTPRGAAGDRGERPARFARDENTRRPAAGGPRGPSGPRGADDARRPFSAAPRGERPARRDQDESRGRGTSERPRFGAERAGAEPRRTFERAPRDENAARRGPAGGRDQRPASGSGERGERSFATPVKRAYGDRPERAPRDDRGTRAPAARGFGDRPPYAERGGRSDRPDGARAPRSSDKATSGSRFNERPARSEKPPRSTAPVARPGRPEDSAPRPAANRRDHDDAPGTLRLSKLMSELGLCSRREADEWIENGWVKVDGEVVDTLGSKVRPDQRIEIDPAAQAIQARLVTILIHKPVGYVSGQAEDGYQPAVTLVTPDNRWEGDNSDIRFSVSHLRRLAPAGRLDIDSTGLLVLTQDGRIAKRLIGGHSEVEKEYLVRVSWGEMTSEIDKHFPAESLELLRHGLELDDAPLKPAKVSWQNGEQLRFVLREGKKRQIRRMCELVGLEVVGLKRVRMGSVPLGALPPGQWRYLAYDESF
ncbi:pseudouridine synthase [Paraburkholderia sp. BCC1885]|uniref:pseudouridine synthase n=1 Tax=Paraburkholderia sp. BCC1885 TaxID=2562669 RepID=UPI001183831D|nr:pseudouridine synthase [Paraburkholderia sp. BCC1885]